MAAFENGLPPHIGIDMSKEDPAATFAISRARAKKHAANHLSNVVPLVTPTQVSAIATADPVPPGQILKHLAGLQDSLAALQAGKNTPAPATASAVSRPSSGVKRTASGASTTHTCRLSQGFTC